MKKPRPRAARRALDRAEAARRARIGAELERSGASARAAAVGAVMRNPFFGRCLRAAITKFERVRPARDEEDIRQIVLGVLRDDFKHDVGDVVLKISWAPATRALRVSAYPGVEAATRAVEIATAATAPMAARAALLARAAGRAP